MARILAILPGNNAIVSTADLYRVVIGEGKKQRIHDELVGFDDAALSVKCLRRTGLEAEAVPYGPLAVPECNDAWKYQYDHSYPQVLAIVPRCVVVSSLGFYRVASERGVPIHEFCTMDSADSLASGRYHCGKGRPPKHKVISYDQLAADPKVDELCHYLAVD